MNNFIRAGLTVVFLTALVACQQKDPEAEQPAAATDATGPGGPKANPDRNAYFGELHLHTSWSFDAYAFQNTIVDPDAAYRYAKGEAVRHLNGEMIRRNTPLDFAAVTDHGEFMGVAQLLTDPNHALYQKPVAAKFRSKDPKEGQEAYLELGGAMLGHAKPDTDLVDPKVVGPVWKRVQEFAEQHNAPGKFTTFIAYEWSSTPNNSNLHRNVIFGGTVVPELPFDAMQSMRPEDLWAYLERARASGSDVIAIPHNGNISNGLMYQTKDSDGKDFTREYAQRRLDPAKIDRRQLTRSSNARLSPASTRRRSRRPRKSSVASPVMSP